jgi:soluble lytic murein transglycosylase-like protein
MSMGWRAPVWTAARFTGLALFIVSVLSCAHSSASAGAADKRTTPTARPVAASAAVQRADRAAARYDEVISLAAMEAGVDPALVRAIIKTESNYDPRAVSRKGAQGLMQLMPGTADRYGVSDPFDPEANIRGGVRYLRFLQDLFPDHLPLVLAAYNAGENAVLRHNGVPPYSETRQYVDRVLAHYGSGDPRGGTPRRTPPAPSSAQTLDPVPPPPTLFRVLDAHGALLYTNVRPTLSSGSQR